MKSVSKYLIQSFAALSFLVAPGAFAADQWPTEAVKIIVPYSPGGNTDLIARTLSEPLSKAIGQPVVVENRAGAGGTVGVAEAAGQKADGYTLVVGDIATMGINPHIYEHLAYDAVKDFDPVIQITSVPLVMGVGPKLGVKTFAEFMDLAKKYPDSIDYASAGVGTAQHLAFEYFKSLAGISGVHISYRGSGPARTALMSGEVGVMIDGTLLPSIQEGIITPLAVTSKERVSTLPDTPTMIELGVDMEYTSWHGIFAPHGTDPAIISKLNTELDKILADPDIKARFAALNINLVGGSPEGFKTFVAKEAVKLGELVKLSGADNR